VPVFAFVTFWGKCAILQFVLRVFHLVDLNFYRCSVHSLDMHQICFSEIIYFRLKDSLRANLVVY
jgi:hypothetical protein